MARKAGEHRCKAHLCCRPTRKTVKNAVMTHCPRIARDNYTPLRPTRYSLFFRSCLRTEARCGRSQYAARMYVWQFIIDYSLSIPHCHERMVHEVTAIINVKLYHCQLVLKDFASLESDKMPYIIWFHSTEVSGHRAEMCKKMNQQIHLFTVRRT